MGQNHYIVILPLRTLGLFLLLYIFQHPFHLQKPSCGLNSFHCHPRIQRNHSKSQVIENWTEIIGIQIQQIGTRMVFSTCRPFSKHLGQHTVSIFAQCFSTSDDDFPSHIQTNPVSHSSFKNAKSISKKKEQTKKEQKRITKVT